MTITSLSGFASQIAKARRRGGLIPPVQLGLLIRLVASYVQTRHGKVAVATINRELATLRRILYLAHDWNEIAAVPRIKMLKGERSRDFVLSHQQEEVYLDAAPQPLKDVALLLLETGLRLGEALALKWTDIELDAANGKKLGYLFVREGKSKNARRHVSLTSRAQEMLVNRSLESKSEYVFANHRSKPYLVTSLDHLQKRYGPIYSFHPTA